MKQILFTMLLLLFAFANATLAHTGLESSTPQEGEVVESELKQITLKFNTDIEQGSTFALEDANGQTIAIENISVTGNTLVGDFKTPLPNGDYIVNWSIIGADGHHIEESFAFSVDIPVSTTDEDAEVGITRTETTDAKTIMEENEETNLTESEVIDENPESNILPIAIVALAALIAVISLFFIRKKK